ncbi:peptidoglycan-binding protein [Candidatus Daviesbacteria bacterium]|nr:peptidoglycan-binding protein [Candidatus Daviesbacteria bacterium]
MCNDGEYSPTCTCSGYQPPPTCPLFSSYDSLSSSCKCNYGYVSDGGRCISEDQYCQDRYGWNSRYNTLTDNCECSYGNVVDPSTNRCISGNQYCWNKYGYNSSYQSWDKSCACSYGYVFNRSGTQCVSRDAACEDQFGFGSEYSSLEDGCICQSGYKFEGSECVLDVQTPIFVPRNPPPSLPSPSPTLPPVQVPKTTPQPTPKPQVATSTPSPKAIPQLKPPYQLDSSLWPESIEQIKILQTALATDKDIYPEGIISGNYGSLTQAAVKRFQRKHELGETGSVDSSTITKFNEVFGEKPTPSISSNQENTEPKNWQRKVVDGIWNVITGVWKAIF